jgi:predicted RNA binding protein YcfA (HicA-like mRNA interferase family)
MTNVYGSPEKVSMKNRLFAIAVQALETEGWKVERERGSGKSSVRRITRNRQSKLVTIRTSQDTWIAFPRTDGDKSWRTLDEVDAVVPVSVDDPENPKFAKVHLIDGDEVRSRFNRAYKARMDAKRSIPVGRGVWVSLYHQEAKDPVSYVGAGMGIKFPPIATVPLSSAQSAVAVHEDHDARRAELPPEESPLSIAEAKRRLAITFGVSPANIKITVEA